MVIDARVEELARVRDFVRRRCADLGAGGGSTADVVQAVDESVTNVIVHGYGGRAGRIEVEIDEGPGPAVVAVIRDSAPVFDPTSVPAPDMERPIEARLAGGMGVYLMREAMDEIRHRVLPDGRNELTMTKRIDSVE
jgi:serine/threonine-protein kinase RsbW